MRTWLVVKRTRHPMCWRGSCWRGWQPYARRDASLHRHCWNALKFLAIPLISLLDSHRDLKIECFKENLHFILDPYSQFCCKNSSHLQTQNFWKFDFDPTGATSRLSFGVTFNFKPLQEIGQSNLKGQMWSKRNFYWNMVTMNTV